MQLNVSTNLAEIIEYDTPYMPIRSRVGKLSHFDNQTALCHWHIELEFIWIVEGTMNYFVDGEYYTLQKGEGIFVNSNRLHYGFAHTIEDCEFKVFLISPQLLVRNEYIEKTYIRPLLQDQRSNAILLSEDIQWKKDTLQIIEQMFEQCQQQEIGYELVVLSQFELLILHIYKHTIAKEGSLLKHSNDMEAIKHMLSYIQNNFTEHIRLEDIAASGSVCRSKCCSLFKLAVKKSPMEYVTQFRVQKSIDFMSNYEMNMTNISEACGFNSPTYFAATFKSIYGVSPTAYRKTLNNH